MAPPSRRWDHRRDTFATDPDANALRWGTLYNFRFDADTSPAATIATLELFKPGTPGTPTSIQFSVMGPAVPMPCNCPGNLDGGTTVDGSDIQPFVEMFLGATPVDPCADLAAPTSGPLDMDDVDAFVAPLLAGTPCP